VNGSITIDGGSIDYTGEPGGLYISDKKSPSSITISHVGLVNAHLYAPASDVTVNGVSNFNGWIIGKTLTLTGTVNLHYDETRHEDEQYKVTLVK